MISRFTGEYAFLANPYPALVTIGGVTYPTREHAFQAGKLSSLADALRVAGMTWREAKWYCNQVELPADWNRVRCWRMLDVVKGTFLQHPDLARMLVATGDEILQEGNSHHDSTWGICLSTAAVHPAKCTGSGTGTNYLGVILMFVRDMLRED